jgi:hypothetical protein
LNRLTFLICGSVGIRPAGPFVLRVIESPGRSPQALWDAP